MTTFLIIVGIVLLLAFMFEDDGRELSDYDDEELNDELSRRV